MANGITVDKLPSLNRFQPAEKGAVVPESIVVYIGNDKAAFHGWESLSINQDLESLAKGFNFIIPQKDTEGGTPMKLTVGTKVSIYTDGLPVLVGRIEMMELVVGPNEKSISVSGRSLSGDIVDCSVEGPTEYNNISLDKLARELLKPFGLKVLLSVVPGVVKKVAVKPGDTVFEVLDRAARIQGFFWVTTYEGNLRLTQAGKGRAPTSIVEGVNLKRGSLSLDHTNRFSKYTVKGQTNADDNFPGVISGKGSGSATDATVSRNRPLLIIAEGNVDNALAKKRAQWEATSRVGKSLKLSIEVQGWKQNATTLWGINQLTHIKAPSLGIDGDFLSTSVQYVRDYSQGTLSKLEFTRKDAYSPAPAIPKNADDSLEAIVAFSKRNPSPN